MKIDRDTLIDLLLFAVLATMLSRCAREQMLTLTQTQTGSDSQAITVRYAPG